MKRQRIAGYPILLLFFLYCLPGLLCGAVYTAGTFSELESAINSVNAGSGGDTIQLTGDITFSALLPSLTQDVTVEGGGYRLDGNNSYRIFTVNGGNLLVRNTELVNGLASGGDGGRGGDAIDSNNNGGGGGAGGGFDFSTGIGYDGANANLQTPGTGTYGGGSGGVGAHYSS
ncbi:MAG TPA: hypothetical protein VJ952_06045, partial [Opitutales bacterium]|nr:hypothetical protein [Opitutales bacterium]